MEYGYVRVSSTEQNLINAYFAWLKTLQAKASALLYSIAKSAKANSLKPYEYFC